MALTRAQLIAKFAPNYAKKLRADLAWTDIVPMIGSSGDGVKQGILDAIKNQNTEALGKIIFKVADDWLRVKAIDAIDQKIVNNRITITDLGDLLG